MKAEDIKKAYERLREQQKQLDETVKETIKSIISKLPDKTLSLCASHAYSYVEATDNWIEVPVYGVRLKDDVLEVSLETNLDDADQQIPDWSEDYVFDDYDHYSTINWLSVLNSITYCLKEETNS